MDRLLRAELGREHDDAQPEPDGSRGRSFKDVAYKGPWRKRREAAQKDGQEMGDAFKYEGETAIEAKIKEFSFHKTTGPGRKS